MNVEEFEKEMQQEPDRVNEAEIKENLEAIEQPEQQQTPEGETPKDEGETAPETDAVTVSLGQLAGMVTGVYCRLSDFVYTKVKKTETAPEWSEDDKGAIEAAIAPVLGKYNVALSPATNLIITLVVIEGMRYTMQKPKEIGNGETKI